VVPCIIPFNNSDFSSNFLAGHNVSLAVRNGKLCIAPVGWGVATCRGQGGKGKLGDVQTKTSSPSEEATFFGSWSSDGSLPQPTIIAVNATGVRLREGNGCCVESTSLCVDGGATCDGLVTKQTKTQTTFKRAVRFGIMAQPKFPALSQDTLIISA